VPENAPVAAPTRAPMDQVRNGPPAPYPLRPGFYQRRWPGPTGAAGPAALAASGVGGVAVAAGLSLDRPGAGWLAAGVATTAALLAVARAAGRPITIRRAAYGSVTLVLLAVGAVRAAGWLFGLCALTATVTGALALAPGRSARAMAAEVLGAALAGPRALPWAGRGAARLRGARATGLPVALTLTTALLLMFVPLLASADPAFGRLLDRVTPDPSAAGLNRTVVLFPLGALLALGAAFTLAAPPDLEGMARPARARLRSVEWAVPVTALVLLFAAFVSVQLTVFFGGSRYVLHTAGVTYAEYARRGFWQLLVVTALTLAVLAAAARWAPRDASSERVLLRVLLGALAVLTLVIVASALHRMHTYQQAYGFTRLRVLVSACELWLGAVFLAVLAAGVRLRGSWLPEATVAAAIAALLGLVALNPDRFIADRNVDRYYRAGRIDVSYLSGLSADAVPALDRLPAALRACALEPIADDLEHRPDAWRDLNLARSAARRLLEAGPDRPIGAFCTR
jgi:Domain of unknown function (DUF4153)